MSVMVATSRTRFRFVEKCRSDDHHAVWILAHELRRRDGTRHNHQSVRRRSGNSPDRHSNGVTSIAMHCASNRNRCRRRPSAVHMASTPCASSCRRRRRRTARQRTQSDGSGDARSGDGSRRGLGTRISKTEARIQHAQKAHPRNGCR